MKQRKISLFAKEILFILFIKILLLYSLWRLCFSTSPVKPDKDHFANRVFGRAEETNSGQFGSQGENSPK